MRWSTCENYIFFAVSTENNVSSRRLTINNTVFCYLHMNVQCCSFRLRLRDIFHVHSNFDSQNDFGHDTSLCSNTTDQNRSKHVVWEKYYYFTVEKTYHTVCLGGSGVLEKLISSGTPAVTTGGSNVLKTERYDINRLFFFFVVSVARFHDNYWGSRAIRFMMNFKGTCI